ncbi:hypothetical protein LTR64_003526 [Lithohypha guttulata]|uniref:uncharacterized protein n=1 Tax=Lithohypha guttulata TaxID=1690604 RepID=UPI002DE1AB53|nr:hypothetical protein LTR51_000256 [Lithohypha guttulata]
MQCPETPQHAQFASISSPRFTAEDSAGTRRRTTKRESIANDLPSNRTAARQSLSSPSKTRIKSLQAYTATTPKYKRNTGYSPNFLVPVQGNSDDVFQSPVARSRKHSSAAVVHFQNAARRLALSDITNNNTSAGKQSTAQPRATSTSSVVQEDVAKNPLQQCSPATPLHAQQEKHEELSSAWAKDVRSALGEVRADETPVLQGKPYYPHAQHRLGPISGVHEISHTSPVRRASETIPPADVQAISNDLPHAQSGGTEHSSSFATLAPNAISSTQDHDVSNASIPPSTSTSAQVPVEPAQQRNDRVSEEAIRASFDSAVTEELGDKRLQLKHWEIWAIRLAFTTFVFTVNIAFGLAYLGSHKHPYLLAILVFMKSKDILSTLADIVYIGYEYFRGLIWPPKESKAHWILSLVCAYAETEEQIMKTVTSLAASDTKPHKQVICIIMDGKPRDIVSKMSKIKMTTQRPYTTWRGKRGEIRVLAGYINGTGVVLVEKVKNAGKKDSLILGHDLFNHPRDDMPQATRLLRQEIWERVLPTIISDTDFKTFGYIFCTDADSTIHENALNRLANALSRQSHVIAACGVLFAEFGSNWTEFHPWHLFQQFQYTFGQYVRRQAESTWGRVTCLPGCITMIVVRPEMGAAISQYARPVTEHNLFRHQVQYLGTDRRLTWCMMSQNKHLRTIFVPDALSETVVPNRLSHYLSQRRRWASNAYFNDYFYALGPQQRLITRLFAVVDIVRLTLVFYRVFNTGYFLYGLVQNFYVIKIIPTLIVTKTPATWYILLTMVKEPLLRKRMHKVLLGMCINQVISPILSVIVFVNVLLHLGSQSWGQTGVSTQGVAPPDVAIAAHGQKPAEAWTPKSLAKSIRTAVRGATPKPKKKIVSHRPVPSSAAGRVYGREKNTQTPLRSSVEDHGAVDYSNAPKGGDKTQARDTDSETPANNSIPSEANPSSTTATPFSRLRTIPRRRKGTISKLDPVTETPTKTTSQQQQQQPCFDFGFKKP